MDIETEKTETHVQSIEILPSLENIFLSHILFDVMTSNTANLSRQQYYLSKKVNSELSVIPVFYIKNRYFTLKPENSPFLLQKKTALIQRIVIFKHCYFTIVTGLRLKMISL